MILRPILLVRGWREIKRRIIGMNGRKIWMNGQNNFFIRRKNLEGKVAKE